MTKDLRRVDPEKVIRLWPYLPKDYKKQVADRFGVNKRTAHYVVKLKPEDYPNMQLRTMEVMAYMIEMVAATFKLANRVEEIDTLIEASHQNTKNTIEDFNLGQDGE